MIVTPQTWRNAGAIAAGAVALLWPALMNGYPLLFSDTGTFLEQLLLPFMVWDKPWIYGPVVVVLSLQLTLWLPAGAQCMAVSWVLWRIQSVFGVAAPSGHVALCLALALGSAAPWFASLLMPDILAPVTVLTLFLLAFDPEPRWRWPTTALAIFAIAAHLAHLLVAAVCLLAILTLRPQRFLRSALPLGVALLLLMATNLAGHGRLGVAPYGAVFALARLTADGPARAYLEQTCPGSGHWLCGWTGRLPSDGDTFLWDPSGPVWSFPGGPVALAPEASRIVLATIASRPWASVRAAVGNGLQQLHTLRLDEVLAGNGLDQTVGAQLHSHYPVAEEAWFLASAQRTGRLRELSAGWQTPHLILLAAGAGACCGLLLWSWRRDRVLFALIAVIAIGVLGNAFATGALAGPHDRYQARIAWLLLLPPLLCASRCWAHRGRS